MMGLLYSLRKIAEEWRNEGLMDYCNRYWRCFCRDLKLRLDYLKGLDEDLREQKRFLIKGQKALEKGTEVDLVVTERRICETWDDGVMDVEDIYRDEVVEVNWGPDRAFAREAFPIIKGLDTSRVRFLEIE